MQSTLLISSWGNICIFADWCIFPDIGLRDGCSMCAGYLQTVLSGDGGKSLQVTEEYQSGLWVCMSVRWISSQCFHGFRVIFFLFFFDMNSDERNILEAVSSGASASIGLVANIAVNLIAFLAILGFVNSALSWLGGMVGFPSITFQVTTGIWERFYILHVQKCNNSV